MLILAITVIASTGIYSSTNSKWIGRGYYTGTKYGTTHEQSQPTHIYQTTNGGTGHTTSQQQTLIERQYLQEVTLSAPQTHLQQEIQLQANTANGNVIIEDPDRRLAAAFLQYVQKEAPQLITNETQVIVSNKV